MGNDCAMSGGIGARSDVIPSPRMSPEAYISGWKDELNYIIHELVIGTYGRPAESLQDRLIQVRSAMENYVGASSRASYDDPKNSRP